MMQGTHNLPKTVKRRFFTKKVASFAENTIRPIEKHIEAVIYCVHNATGGMADEKAIAFVQYG